MSTEPKTPEELAAEAFPPKMKVREWDDVPSDFATDDRKRCAAALRKQAEQCRPYMQHKQNCEMWLDHPTHYCTCGLDTVLNSMK